MQLAIPEQALSQHIADLGKTGSGKTTTAKNIIAYAFAKDSRVCILDPVKSDWWGLTSSADGKHAGLPFCILGGPHGHVPLQSSAGEAIGKLVATGELRHSIIDMADFEMGGVQRFFVHFAEALFRNVRGVVYLVLEEAHEFAPKERSGIGSEAMAIFWAKKLATAARTKGIRLIVLTQRTQALHNALLGSCDTLITHRLTAPADQEPVKDWLKHNVSAEVRNEVAGSLAKLKNGEAWVCSGEAQFFQRVTFPKTDTYDNTATPRDDSTVEKVRTAPIDITQLRAIVGYAIKVADENDPDKLRARIAELEERLALTNEPQNDPEHIERVEEAAMALGRRLEAPDAEARGIAIGQARGERIGYAKALSAAQQAVLALRVPETEIQIEVTAEPPPRKVVEVVQRALQRTAAPPIREVKRPATNGVSPTVRKILDTVHAAYPVPISFAAAATRAVVSKRSSQYSNYERAVLASPEVEHLDGKLRSARGFARPVTVSGGDPVEAWAQRLPPSPANVLRALKATRRALSREEIAVHAGISPTSSGLGKAIGDLRSLELIEPHGDNFVLCEHLRARP